MQESSAGSRVIPWQECAPKPEGEVLNYVSSNRTNFDTDTHPKVADGIRAEMIVGNIYITSSI